MELYLYKINILFYLGTSINIYRGEPALGPFIIKPWKHILLQAK